jgi:PPK2 family polyphosphate:nucleotide phosphotransferase
VRAAIPRIVAFRFDGTSELWSCAVLAGHDELGPMPHRSPEEFELERFIEPLVVPPGKSISLRNDFDPGYTSDYVRKSEANALLQDGIRRLASLQDSFYAQSTYALLIVLQAMDAAGKDSVIKHVMSGLNPQGCQVWSFRQPSAEDLEHDYLWRTARVLPRRGTIGIFNRSYYEEVLVVRVHRELLERQRLPPHAMKGDIWQRRFREINAFEQYLVDNGIVVLKFFLNVSKQEQRKRFLERIQRPDKHWKFSASDVRERQRWDAYIGAYQEALNATSTHAAPWYVIPADHKWFTRLAVAAVVVNKLQELNPSYPEVTAEQRRELGEAEKLLNSEE